MKYKVGDKVKIIFGNCNGKQKDIGKIATIINLEQNSNFPYTLDIDNIYNWKDAELELLDELKDGDIVYVSDSSEKDALKNKDEAIYINTLPKGKISKYICVDMCYKVEYDNGEDYRTTNRRYAIKKPLKEKKERKIECTDEKWSEIQEILNLK